MDMNMGLLIKFYYFLRYYSTASQKILRKSKSEFLLSISLSSCKKKDILAKYLLLS